MILASNNAHKLTEIRAILADLGIDLIPQSEAGCDFEVEETGMYYLKSRYYDPEIKKFISSDEGLNNTNGLLGLNLYIYCLNSPTNYYDDNGKDPYGVLKPKKLI